VIESRSAVADSRRRRYAVVAGLIVVAFGLYALTISRTIWTTDVFGANWTSWHIANTGSPWIDDATLPWVGHRSDRLLAIVQAHNGHTAFGRFPGVVLATLPAYLVFGTATMSTVPGSLTAALLTAIGLALMFSGLRRHLTDAQALLVTVALGFATPVWTVSANLMWPQTITFLGIAGMAWASASDRWWWAGAFGGLALWGRVHASIIVAVLGLGVAVHRRDLRPLLRVAITSTAALLASSWWIHWMYGTWNPLGAYDGGRLRSNADEYRFSIVNQLGTWVAPDRGILVWTPVVLLLLPALVRSWRTLPDWSRSLLLGGLVYTVVGSALDTFTAGEGFYGYRYGLEMLACATPALAFSHPRMGRAARTLLGPVLGVQFFAFLVGAMLEQIWLPQSLAWRDNAFVHALDRVGWLGWAAAAFAAFLGFVIARRFGDAFRTPVPVAHAAGVTTDQITA
jgi:hypothetical protein